MGRSIVVIARKSIRATEHVKDTRTVVVIGIGVKVDRLVIRATAGHGGFFASKFSNPIKGHVQLLLIGAHTEGEDLVADLA